MKFFCLISLLISFHLAYSSELKYAKRYSMEEYNGVHLVTINHPWPRTTIKFHYVLHKKGQAIPGHLKKHPRIQIPIRKVVTQSTSMLPFIDKLDVIDRLVGVETSTYINNPKILKQIKNKKVREVGGANQINIERLYMLSPDVVLTYGTTMSSMNNYSRLSKAGISNMVLATYTEETLLGRSEWIKLFGVLFDKEKEADAIFKTIEDNYNKELSKIKKQAKKPTVFCNTPYGTIWHMPSGRTWIADAIESAGGQYLWRNDQSTMGTLKLNTEVVYFKALQADIWLGPSHNRWLTYDDVRKTDSRFEKFKAFKDKQIFLNNKRLNANGGNDIYEKGMIEPHLILRDLVTIISGNREGHPKMTFYQKVQ